MNQEQKDHLDAIRTRWDTVVPEDFARYPKGAEQSFADVRALLDALDAAQRRMKDLEAALSRLRDELIEAAYNAENNPDYNVVRALDDLITQADYETILENIYGGAHNV